jgi:hypothetical protein
MAKEYPETKDRLNGLIDRYRASFFSIRRAMFVNSAQREVSLSQILWWYQ